MIIFIVTLSAKKRNSDRVIDLLYTKYLTVEISYDNITRIEHFPFPKDAVREAVFNALDLFDNCVFE